MPTKTVFLPGQQFGYPALALAEGKGWSEAGTGQLWGCRTGGSAGVQRDARLRTVAIGR